MKLARALLVPPQADLAGRLAESLLREHEARLPDLSGLTILIPGAAATASLHAALAVQARRGLLGPRIQTLNQFALERGAAPPLSAAECRLILVEALRKYRGLFAGQDPWRLAEALFALFEELSLNAVSLPDDAEKFADWLAQAYGAAKPLAALSREAQIIHTLWRGFLADTGGRSPATAYVAGLRQALDGLQEGESVYLAGFDNLAGGELAALAGSSSTARIELWLHGRTEGRDGAALKALCARLGRTPQPVKAEGGPQTSARSRLLDAALAEIRGPAPAEAPGLRITRAAGPEHEARCVDLAVREAWLAGKSSIAVVTEDRRLASAPARPAGTRRRGAGRPGRLGPVHQRGRRRSQRLAGRLRAALPVPAPAGPAQVRFLRRRRRGAVRAGARPDLRPATRNRGLDSFRARGGQASDASRAAGAPGHRGAPVAGPGARTASAGLGAGPAAQPRLPGSVAELPARPGRPPPGADPARAGIGAGAASAAGRVARVPRLARSGAGARHLRAAFRQGSRTPAGAPAHPGAERATELRAGDPGRCHRHPDPRSARRRALLQPVGAHRAGPASPAATAGPGSGAPAPRARSGPGSAHQLRARAGRRATAALPLDRGGGKPGGERWPGLARRRSGRARRIAGRGNRCCRAGAAATPPTPRAAGPGGAAARRAQRHRAPDPGRPPLPLLRRRLPGSQCRASPGRRPRPQRLRPARAPHPGGLRPSAARPAAALPRPGHSRQSCGSRSQAVGAGRGGVRASTCRAAPWPMSGSPSSALPSRAWWNG